MQKKNTLNGMESIAVKVHDGAPQSLATMSDRKRPPSEALAERVAAFSVATVARAYSGAYEL